MLQLDDGEVIVQSNAILWYLGEGTDYLPAYALDTLDAHLTARDVVVGDTPSIADLSLFAYTHVAPDAGLDLSAWPAVERWVARIEAMEGFMDDYVA